MADMLEGFLQQNQFAATSIHGDRTQREREKALDTFRTGRTPVMVATAVAARGLDISNVSHVVNYDLPSDVDDYVHRIGRTGRAGNVGRSTAFFNRGNKGICRDLIELLREAKQEVPDWLEAVAMESGFSSGGRGRGRGRGGAGRSGNADFRRQPGYNSSGFGGPSGGSGFGGPPRMGGGFNGPPIVSVYGGGSYGGPPTGGPQANNWW